MGGQLGLKRYLVLAAGVLAVSSAAILISFALRQGVPPLVIAALRLAFSAVILLPLAVVRARAEILRITLPDALRLLASGLLLALHFAFWISSLQYTSVMSSVVLVSTNPLFVGLASLLILREPLTRWTIAGIAAAVAGALVIALSDLGRPGAASARGDILALLGAAAVSGYLLFGRALRKGMSLLAYTGIVYAIAAAVLVSLAAISGARFLGYPAMGYLLVALLAVGPQLIGHTSYNWALKYVSATFVTVTLLAEPIGATLIAIPLLSEVPSAVKAAGAGLILAGIYISSRGEKRNT